MFRNLKISVDVVATSEVSVSLTLDPKKLDQKDEYRSEQLVAAFRKDGQQLAQVRLGELQAAMFASLCSFASVGSGCTCSTRTGSSWRRCVAGASATY